MNYDFGSVLFLGRTGGRPGGIGIWNSIFIGSYFFEKAKVEVDRRGMAYVF